VGRSTAEVARLELLLTSGELKLVAS